MRQKRALTFAKLNLLFWLMVLAPLGVWAQNPEVSAKAPRVVAVNERFQIVYTTNTQPSGFKQPDLSEFSFSGPSSSRSFSTTMINGKVTQNSEFTYTYVAQAAKVGKFTIQPAKFIIEGKTYETNALTIEVVASKKSSTQATDAAQAQQGAKVSDEDIFIRVNLNKTSIYQGEGVVATVKIYTRVSIRGFEDVKLPNFDGFWAQDLETPSNINLERENVDGIIYETGVIRKSLLYPNRDGVIKIEPAMIQANVMYRVQPQSFWDDGYRQSSKKLFSPERTITVKSLPAPRPADFYGAVGQFTMTAEVDKTELVSNDALTYKLTISGTGNLRLITEPKVNFPSDFEKLDTSNDQNISVSEGGAKGSRTFEYNQIARHKGEYEIPAVTMSYFDPKTGQYKQLSTQAVQLKVAQGDQTVTGSQTTEMRKENVRTTGNDILFIKTNTHKLYPKDYTIFGTWWYWVYFTVLSIGFGVLVIALQKQIRQNKNVSLVRQKRAGKVSQKRLKLAATYLKDNKREAFFDELLKALWGYMSDKLNIELAKLSKESMTQALQTREISPEIITRFIRLVDDCELARYAPVGDRPMPSAYDEATELINILEQKL